MNHKHKIRHIYSSSGSQCDQAYFSIGYYSKTIQTTCNTNRCNSYDYAAKLANMKCESNQTSNLMRKEISFNIKDLSESTKYCYYCKECENPINDMIKIDCNPYNRNISYSCQVKFSSFFDKMIFFLIDL